jgi:hypothetical protein
VSFFFGLDNAKQRSCLFSAERYHCTTCNKTFNQRQYYLNHFLNNHREIVEAQWLRCDLCDHFSPSKESLKRHAKIKHKTKAKKSNCRLPEYVCPFCKEKLSKCYDSISKHCTKKHFDIVSKIWPLCDVCGDYVQPRRIKSHRTIHEKRIKCPFCEGLFADFNLVRHVNMTHFGGNFLPKIDQNPVFAER